MNIRNRQLYEKHKNIIISAFNMLKEYSDKKSKFPSTIKEKVIFHRDGGFSLDYLKKPNFKPFIYQHDKEILNLSEFKLFSDFFENDERLKLLRKIEGKTANNASASHVILDFLLRLADRNSRSWLFCCPPPIAFRRTARTGLFKFNIKTFNKLYIEYEDYLYLDIFNYQCFCLLMNFQSDIENIRLKNGIIIKKVSNNERKKIWRLRTLPEFKFFSLKWIMQFQVILKRGEKFQLPGDIFDDLITALRLFKAGIVGYKHIYYHLISKWNETLGASLRGREFSGKTYTLSKSEGYKFKKWWGEFMKLKAPKIEKEVDIAINRFNYSYERTKLEDKLIDYIIAFESLLLESSQELKYKFALRGAFLLGKEIKDPKKRYLYMKKAKEFLGQAYSLRSNIVHGTKDLKKKIVIDNEEIFIQKFIESIEEYLRKSIKIFWEISNGKSKKEILKKLDDAIFNIS